MFVGTASHSQTSPAAFGQHFPNGLAAVDYIYNSSTGLWRDQTGLHYNYNYYPEWATPSHPYKLLTDAAGPGLLDEGATRNATARDANGLLLGDLDNNGEITDNSPAGYAFFEHRGRGSGGAAQGAPFYAFWFDDNWVARYMAMAYGRPLPAGLHDNRYPIRWRQVAGDNSYWSPYPASSFIDRIALNGINKINSGNFVGALSDWTQIKNLSAWFYDSDDQRYEYALIDTYYYGLWAILSERLLAASASFPQRNDVLQHAIALRSNLLSFQEKSGSTPLGWRTDILNSNSLMNTETLAVSVLALGANATWVLEPGYAPLHLRRVST